MNQVSIRKLQVGIPRLTPFGWEIDSVVTGEVYTIEMNRWNRWQCSCPSAQRFCKHIRRVKDIMDAEQDSYPICT